MATLVGSQIIFPLGQSPVGMSRTSPGPVPCPGGGVNSPFAAFPAPVPGTNRWYRLKAIYFDENVAGNNHVQVMFNLGSGAVVTFNLPQVSSGQGAMNYGYSDWYKPVAIDKSDATVNAFFLTSTVANPHAGVFSLILEAHDIYSPQTSTTHSYTVTLTNKSTLALITHAGDAIAPNATWTSELLGNGYVANPQFGTLSFLDIGTTHIDGDSSETFGCIISLRGFDYVGRYNANGQLTVSVSNLLQAQLGGGMTLTPVEIEALFTA